MACDIVCCGVSSFGRRDDVRGVDVNGSVAFWARTDAHERGADVRLVDIGPDHGFQDALEGLSGAFAIGCCDGKHSRDRRSGGGAILVLDRAINVSRNRAQC